MDKTQFVLSVFSLMPDTELSPIQVQKLFFLIDRRLSHVYPEIKYFPFEPYFYGPYSFELSKLLEQCLFENRLSKVKLGKVDSFLLKSDNALDIVGFLSHEHRDFIKNLAAFVKSLSFRDLCFAIYKEFPDMAARSVLLKD